MIWHDDINELKAPDRIVVSGTGHVPDDVRKKVVMIRDDLALDRQDCIDQNDVDVDVSLEILD